MPENKSKISSKGRLASGRKAQISPPKADQPLPRRQAGLDEKIEIKTAKPTMTKKAKIDKKTVSVKRVVNAVVAKPKQEKQSKLQGEVFDLTGKIVGKVSLPEEIFGVKVNKALLAQAVRVYLANQRQGTASTKTRGEVRGSTRKIYRQKGTGRARHGGVRAPIFVHGGLVFGPKPRDYSLKLPQKMRRAALFSSLTVKQQDGKMKFIADLSKITPKAKEFAALLKKLALTEKKRKVLVVLHDNNENIRRSAQNISGVVITLAKNLHAYDVLHCYDILFTKESIAVLKENFLKE